MIKAGLFKLCSEYICSGGFRILERGVQPLACEAHPKNWGCHAHFQHVKVWTEYLEATLGLVKRLEISKELTRECVTVPGCCCCMPLLHNHLMESCSYVRKNTLLAAKGGCIYTSLTPPKSTTDMAWTIHSCTYVYTTYVGLNTCIR